MKAALLALFALIKAPLCRQLSSQKFWTAVIGTASTYLAKKGIVLDPGMAPYVAGFFALLLAGQAANDHGKAAAQIHANSMNGATIEPIEGRVLELDSDAPNQAGFARLELLGIVGLTLLVLLAAACGVSARERAIHTTYTAAVAAQAGFESWDRDHQMSIAKTATSYEGGLAELDSYKAKRAKVVDGFVAFYRLLAAASIANDDPKSLDSALHAWSELAAALSTATGGKLP